MLPSTKYAATVQGAPEKPIKGLLSNGAGVRMSVGEALTNLVWAKITALEDVKCSGNWMWDIRCNEYEALAKLYSDLTVHEIRQKIDKTDLIGRLMAGLAS